MGSTMKTLLLCLVLAFSVSAQPDRGLGRAPVQARRLALVIGNDAYAAANALHNAVNDATGMKAALEAVGFSVQVGVNLTQQQMETKIDDFTGSVRPGDTALFFYSGHGMQISDQNYLVPVDFNARTAVDAKYKAYPAQRVQENLEAAGVSLQIIILDACRNNPFRSWRGGSDGLAAMNAGRGTYIAFATAPGRVADDNPTGRNGLFTGALMSVLGQGGLSIDQVFNRVREQVARRSNGLQLPWSTSSVTGDFYFNSGESAISVPPRDTNPTQPSDLAVELAYWNSIKEETDATLFEEYLKEYPKGRFTTIARSKLNRLKNTPDTAAKPLSNSNSSSYLPSTSMSRPQVGDKNVNPKDGLTYVWIQPGTFMMGCSPGDNDCTKEWEEPMHQVTITKGFWIGQTEVTQAAYERVMRTNPSYWKGPSLPVEQITWNEARAYCSTVGLRLPTEAEWEYAARGGISSARYGDVDSVAWYASNSGRQTHDVAQKQPNAYGLYDMLGNVEEWVADPFVARYYAQSPAIDPQGPTSPPKLWVMRGGAWGYDSPHIRV